MAVTPDFSDYADYILLLIVLNGTSHSFFVIEGNDLFPSGVDHNIMLPRCGCGLADKCFGRFFVGGTCILGDS